MKATNSMIETIFKSLTSFLTKTNKSMKLMMIKENSRSVKKLFEEPSKNHLDIKSFRISESTMCADTNNKKGYKNTRILIVVAAVLFVINFLTT